MNSKKGDLEFIFNLLWKNKHRHADDTSNIIGMYDIPSTTHTWCTFKAYLLKNSGCSSDIRVFYIDSNGRDILIDSQSNFQIALYTFRRKATVGEVITLKLEKLVAKTGDRKKLFAKRKNDVQIQVQSITENSTNTTQTYDVPTRDRSTSANETPPEWFLTYMAKFKTQLLEEMHETMFQLNVKQREPSSNTHPRRSKSESHKRLRKYQVDITKNLERELSKHTKLEHKLESKLEKLEHKTMKIKAKKLALNRTENDIISRNLSKRLIGIDSYDNELIDAKPVDSAEIVIPHMNGGESYLQQWQVMNIGQIKWDANTQLKYAWGSEALIPAEKTVSCPELSPGEQGIVSVLLEVPETPGHYECYWHFYHNGHRFGHWLGCIVIVDVPQLKTHSLTYEVTLESSPNEMISKQNAESESSLSVQMQDLSLENNKNDLLDCIDDFQCGNNAKTKFDDIKRSKEAISSDSDNVSVISLSGSNSGSSLSDYVVLREGNDEGAEGDKDEAAGGDKPQPTNIDEILKIAENNDGDFAYVVYNGEKYPFHKDYLREEFYEQAEKVRKENADKKLPVEPRTPSPMPLTDSKSSTSSNRLFIFPQHSPGFEVVYPMDESYSSRHVENDHLTCDVNDSFCTIVNSSSDIVGREEELDDVLLDEARTNPIPIQDTRTNNVESYYYNYNKPSSHPSGRCSPYAALAPTCACNNFSPTSMTTSTVYTSPTMEEAALLDPNHTRKVYGPFPIYVPNTSPTTSNVQAEAAAVAEAAAPLNANPTRTVYIPRMVNGQTEAVGAAEAAALLNPNPTRTVYTPPTMDNGHAEAATAAEAAALLNPNPNPVRRDNIITNAAILASSAMCTARNMVNMVIQGNDKWMNGQCVTFAPDSKREKALNTLSEMGFNNRDLNITLLNRYKDDIEHVIYDLISI